MGKYAATRAMNNDRKNKGSGSSFSDTAAYLLDVPESEGQYAVQSFLSGALPRTFGAYYSYRDNTAFMHDYMRNTGLDWSDIKYPARTVGWGSSGVSARNSYDFVSSNLHRLYGRRK